VLSLLSFLLFAAAMAQVPAGPGADVAKAPPAQSLPAPPPWPATRDLPYHLERLRASERELRWRFGAEGLGILEKLNRADAPHLGRLETLVVPDPPLVGDELRYSPLPPLWAWAGSFPKALVVDQPSQVFGAYECGRLVRWGPVSSGRRQRPTPAGLFHLNWRMRGRRSTENPDWYMTWYFNFDNARGLAVHQLELPGHPASHACVRLLERDARWIYGWGAGWTLDAERRSVVALGTPVLVVGAYDFGAPPAWRSLAWLAEGVRLP